MAKKNTAKGPDKNSIRSKKRAKTGITTSRPNRRAQERLSSSTRAYDPADPASNKPGALNHW